MVNQLVLIDRSYSGVFVGLSPVHAGSVPMIFNPQTQLVSLQFCVILDKGFDALFPEDSEELQNNFIFHSLIKFNKSQEDWTYYVDTFSDNQCNQFFDLSWDYTLPLQQLKAKKNVVRIVLTKEFQRNSVLRKKLGMQKGLEGGLPIESGNGSESDFLISSCNSSVKSKQQRGSQYFGGTVVFDCARNVVWNRTKIARKNNRRKLHRKAKLSSIDTSL